MGEQEKENSEDGEEDVLKLALQHLDNESDGEEQSLADSSNNSSAPGDDDRVDSKTALSSNNGQAGKVPNNQAATEYSSFENRLHLKLTLLRAMKIGFHLKT